MSRTHFTTLALSAIVAVSLAAAGCKSTAAAQGPAAPTAAAAPVTANVKPKESEAPKASAAAPKLVTSVEGASEYALDNGLRIVLFPDDSQAKQTLNLLYLVGSRHEGYGESGMAHLLEHMLFKGSAKHPKLDEEFRAHGAVSNANTWYDRTNYWESLPASDENLEFAIEMEADRMVNSNIAADELAKEFSVVRNEFERNENDPSNVLSERVWSTAYLWHNYGKSTIGSRADIERVPADTLKRFYQKYYRPDNAVLIITGKIDPDKTLALVQKHFGPLARPAAPLPKTYTVEPVQDGERTVTLRRAGDVQVVGLAYHITSGGDARYAAVKALQYALTDQPTGRLYKALVKTGLASSVNASSLALWDPGILEIEAQVPMGKSPDVVRDKMIATIEGLAKNKLTDDEIARYKAFALKNWELAMANSQGAAFAFAEGGAAGDWRLVFLSRDRIETLNAGAVNDVAATFLKASNRTVGVFYPTKSPERAPLTEAPDVAAMTKEYKGRKAATAGEAFEASLENVEKRTTRKTVGGVKLALLPKKTRGDIVVAQLTLHYGTEKDLAGHDEAAAMVGTMLMRGTTKHTYEQLKTELDKLKAQVGISGADGSAIVSVKTVRANLIPTLALVAEILRQPAFPAEHFEVLKKQELTDLDESLSDPQSQAFLAVQRKLSPYPKTDVRYVPTTAESIARTKATTLADVKRIYSTLWCASSAEMVVVGDFDPEETTAAIEKGIAGWKSPRPWKRIETPYKEIPAATEVIDTPDKENAVITVGTQVEMRDDDADYPALFIANFILGSGMESRLMTRLRQKEGWSYGTFSQLAADPFDKRSTFFGMALVAPQNAAKALATMIEEIQRLVTEGIPPEELERAKAGYLATFKNQLANDQAIVAMLGKSLYVGRTLEHNMKINAAIGKLTPDDMGRVLKKGYIKPAAFVTVTAGDQKKANAPAAPASAAPTSSAPASPAPAAK